MFGTRVCRLLLSLPVLGLGGCFPVIEEYYKPSGEGIYSGDATRCSDVPRDAVIALDPEQNYDIGGIWNRIDGYAPGLKLSAWQDGQDAVRVVVDSYDLRDSDDPHDTYGQELDLFDQESLTAFDPLTRKHLARDSLKPVKATYRIWDGPFVPNPPGLFFEYSGQRVEYPRVKEEVTVVVWYEHRFVAEGLSAFVVEVPGFVYKGIRHEPREISFEKTSGVFIAGINC